MNDIPLAVGAYSSAIRGEPTVGVTLTRSLLEAVVELGVPRNDLLAAAGLTEQMLEEPDTRVSAPRHEAIYAFASRWLGNEDRVWQQVATHRRPEAYHVLGYLFRNSKTLGEAIKDVLKYIRVISEVYNYHLDVDGDIAILGEAPNPYGYRSAPLSLVGTLASWTTSLRWLLGTDFNPLEIQLNHSQPPDLRAYEAFFRCPVVFDQTRWGIVFEAQLLDRPTATHDTGLQTLLRQQADQLVTRLPVCDAYATRVKQILSDGMHGGNAGIAEVSGKLGISVRTLQRRLHAEGVSFSQLLDNIRTTVAIRHVSNARLSLGEIAYLLGYSDPVAFHHAFQRWTGIAPGEYRKQCSR